MAVRPHHPPPPHRAFASRVAAAARALVFAALCGAGLAAAAAEPPPWARWREALHTEPGQVQRQLEAQRDDGWPEADRVRLALLRLHARDELGRGGENVAALAALEPRVKALGDAALSAQWHLLSGNALRMQDRETESEVHWAQALALAERVGDTDLRSTVHTARAQAALDAREMGAAAAALEQNRQLAQASGDPRLLARHAYWSANMALELGDSARAEALFRDAAARYEALRNPTWWSDSLRLLAQTLIEDDRAAAALPPATEAVRLLDALDDEVYLAIARASLAQALMAHGRRDEALAMARRARDALAVSGPTGARASTTITLARLLAQVGRVDEAAQLLAAVRTPAAGAPALPGPSQRYLRRGTAEVLTAQGRPAEALAAWSEVLRDERDRSQRRLAEQLQAQDAARRVQTLQRENELLQARSRDAERALAAEARARWATTAVVLMLVAGAAGGLWWMTRVNRRIREVAARDALTGLLNRRSVLAATAVGDARRRRDRALALVLIDVDHFKRVNDTHGHAAGDEVLRQVAARLRHGLRGDDLIARWGGEEFLLVLHGAGLDAAAALAERQRRLVAELPVVLPQTAAPLVVTVSAGVSVVADGERTLEAALERADRALYRAKAAGRNTVEVLAPGDGDAPPNGGATPSSDATSATSAPLNAAEPV